MSNAQAPTVSRHAIKDDAQFRALWNGELTQQELADHYKVTRQTVVNAALAYGYKPRGLVSGARRVSRERCRPDPDAQNAQAEAMPDFSEVKGGDFWTRRRDHEVYATGGRYRGVAELATLWDVPCRFILARWHKLRCAK